MTIDVHHHMLPPPLVAAMKAAGLTSAGGEAVPTSWTPAQSLTFMDRHAIDSAILSVPTPLPATTSRGRTELAREINTFAYETTRDSADRFGFFATLPLPDVPAAIVEARHALDELHADGVALMTNHNGVYQGDPQLDPLYAELSAREAVCFVHPAVPWIDGRPIDSPLAAIQASVLEFPFDTTRAIANVIVSGTPRRFPGLRFLFTHAGGCVSSLAGRMIDRRPLVAAYSRAQGNLASEEVEAMLEEARRGAANDLTAFHFDVALSSDEQALAALTTLIPATQLMLGTDFPIAQEIGARVTLAGLERFSGFTLRDRDAVDGANAGRLFPKFAEPGGSAGANAAGDP
jgi:predicted TIM-barrel fold metal-dependent hydrolase